MLTFTRKRAVLLALAQVWLIVMGTCAAIVTGKVVGQSPNGLPFATAFLVYSGPALLALPLAWICVVLLVRMRSDSSQRRQAVIYIAGWLMLAVLVVFVAYALIRPWKGFFFDALPSATYRAQEAVRFG